MGDADVQRAAKRLAAALGEMNIPYAICGALAVTAHGHARLTQDVDVLLTVEGLERFKKRGPRSSLIRKWSASSAR